MSLNLTIVRGLPGSGKSTTAKMMLSSIKDAGRDVMHYEADMYFMQNGVYHFDINFISDAHDWCQESTISSLMRGEDVIVSNTFTTIREMKPYFLICKDFDIVPNIITCQSNFGSIHNVPQDTIEKMSKRFTYDLTPLFDIVKEYDFQQ